MLRELSTSTIRHGESSSPSLRVDKAGAIVAHANCLRLTSWHVSRASDFSPGKTDTLPLTTNALFLSGTMSFIHQRRRRCARAFIVASTATPC
jgi:hypothetical protein